MQILANSLDIEKNICDCIEKYKNISMSIAWASAHSKAFKLLVQNKNIKKLNFPPLGYTFIKHIQIL